MYEVKNKITRLFCCVCVVIPFMMAAFLALVCLSGIYGRVIPRYTVEYHFLLPMNHNIIGALFLCAMAFLCYWILRGAFAVCGRWIRNGLFSEIFLIFSIFALACLMRFSLIRLYQDRLQPFSDFLRVWKLAHGDLEGGNFTYYTLFPAYLNFAAFENALTRIFGDNYLYMLYLNVLSTSLIAALIYCIARLLKIGKRQSMLSASLYVFMPANLCYCAVGSPDFLTILFNTIGAALFLCALRAGSNFRRCFFTLCGGLSIGIGSAYKTFGLVILIAFIMTLALKLFFADGIEKRERLNRVFVVTLCFLLSVCAYKATLTGVTRHTEDLFDVELDFSASVPHFLMVGLNTKGDGQIHTTAIASSYVNEYMRNGHDAKAAAEVAYGILRDDWAQNAKDAPLMFIRKMIWVWQDDGIPLWYFVHSVGINADENLDGWAARVYSFVERFGGSVGELFYFFLMLFAMFGCLSFVSARIFGGRTNNIESKTPHYGSVYILLIIFGYFCMTFLSEGQSRYKNLIMPFICLISGYGIHALSQAVKVLRAGKE